MTDQRHYIALCAGAGLGCEGLRSAGFECKLFVEWDQERQDVLRFNHPGVPIFGDIQCLLAKDVPKVALWFVTLPCQPFSIGGRRKGLADTRGKPIFDSFIRVLSESVGGDAGPRFILFENVPGWLQGEHEAAKCLCSSLEELGFRPLWGEILNARQFGTPQDRNRVFLLFGRSEELQMLRLKNKGQGRQEVTPESLCCLPLAELDTELDYEAIAAIEPRLRERTGSASLSANMLRKAREFTGLNQSRHEWAGRAVFHSARNPRCFQPGFSPTVTKDARLLVRFPDSGRIYRVGSRGYERLMGVRPDLTLIGVDEKGRDYVVRDRSRKDMCGDGVVASVAEWIARSIQPLL